MCTKVSIAACLVLLATLTASAGETPPPDHPSADAEW
jgi:hypothetical protein